MKDVYKIQALENIEVKNLWLKRGTYQIFKDFSYSFPAGKVTALMASSGAGKTSLLDCIAGLLKPDQGNIVGGASVSYLFQEPRLLPWYSLEKNVMLPVESLMGRETAKERSDTFLKAVSLEEKIDSLPTQCSGGQRQRCAIARAFALHHLIPEREDAMSNFLAGSLYPRNDLTISSTFMSVFVGSTILCMKASMSDMVKFLVPS